MLEKELESRIQSAFSVSNIGKDFHFNYRKCAINWVKVVSADINKVINEKDYGCLKENVLNVVNYDLDSAVTSKILDPGFVKLFRLAQLTIEYLLYTQNIFQKQSKQLSEEKNNMKEELEKFVVGRKESVGDQKHPFNAPESRKEAHLVLTGNDSSNTFRCMLCGKIFLNGCYLYAHHQRRHSQNIYPSLVEVPKAASSFPSKLPEKSNKIPDEEMEKIWKELEWLRKKVYESLITEKPVYQNISQSEVPTKSSQNLFPQWPRSSQHSPEKRNDAVPMRVQLNTAIMESNIDDVAKENEEMEKSNEQKIMEEESTEEKEEEIYFEHVLKNSHSMKTEPTKRKRIGDINYESFSEHMHSSPRGEESQKRSVPERAAVEDSGKLEAQERVWRGRLKALADKSSQEIESLRKVISSLQEKECNLEEEYQEKIEKLSLRLREQAFKPTDDKAVGTGKLEEPVKVVPPIPSIVEDFESPPSSRDSTIISLSPAKQPESRESPLISPVSNASEVRSRTSDLEYDSSDVSTSPNVIRRRLPSDHTSEDEESDQEMAVEVFEKRLRHLNINPEAKAMPEKVFKDKMEMLNAERRLLKRDIENYHHIKSNLEEKADARVSQRILRLKHDKSKTAEESPVSGSGYRSPKDVPSQDKMKEFLSSTSSKESLVATTSRSVVSSYSHLPSGRTIVSQSSLRSITQRSDEDLPYQSRISVMNEILKSSKGMGATTEDYHSRTSERHILPGVSLQPSSGMGEGHGYSSVGGSILRGLHNTRGEGEKVATVPSFGSYGSKSVSFANDLIGGKAYRAV